MVIQIKLFNLCQQRLKLFQSKCSRNLIKIELTFLNDQPLPFRTFQQQHECHKQSTLRINQFLNNYLQKIIALTMQLVPQTLKIIIQLIEDQLTQKVHLLKLFQILTFCLLAQYKPLMRHLRKQQQSILVLLGQLMFLQPQQIMELLLNLNQLLPFHIIQFLKVNFKFQQIQLLQLCQQLSLVSYSLKKQILLKSLDIQQETSYQHLLKQEVKNQQQKLFQEHLEVRVQQCCNTSLDIYSCQRQQK